MLWLSSNVAAVDCPIVLVQNSCGQFLGTKTKCLVFIGNVPKITFPKKLKNKKLVAIKHSTPLRNEDTEEKVFGSGQEILSPIAEKSGNSSIEHDHTYSSDDKETEKIREEVRDLEEANFSTTVDEGNMQKEEGSMSTEFPEHNVMESSVDLALRSDVVANEDTSNNHDQPLDVDTGVNETEIVNVQPESAVGIICNSNNTTNMVASDSHDDGVGSGDLRSENSVLDNAFVEVSQVSSVDTGNGSMSTVICSLNSVPTDSTPANVDLDDGKKADHLQSTCVQPKENSDADRTVTATNDEVESDSTISYTEETKQIDELLNSTNLRQKEGVEVSGVEKNKLIVKISLKDIKKDIGTELKENSSFLAETDNEEKCTKLVSYRCNKCKYICFTTVGYETHMFHSHRIHNIEKYQYLTVFKRNIGPPTSPDWTSSNEERGTHPDKISKGKSEKDALKEPINSDTVDASEQSDVKTTDTNVNGRRHQTVEKPNTTSGGAKEV